MASKVTGTHTRAPRPIKYPNQLVVMVNDQTDEAVRKLAQSRGESISDTMRFLLAKGLGRGRTFAA